MQRTPLHVGTEYDHIEVVKLLIASGADFNYQDSDGSTPLHIASQQGSINTLDYLIKETKIDLFAKNKYGQIASDIAQNISIRQRFESGEEYSLGSGLTEASTLSKQSQNSQYARTAYNGVLMHNHRIDTVQKLMNKY